MKITEKAQPNWSKLTFTVSSLLLILLTMSLLHFTAMEQVAYVLLVISSFATPVAVMWYCWKNFWQTKPELVLLMLGFSIFSQAVLTMMPILDCVHNDYPTLNRQFCTYYMGGITFSGLLYVLLSFLALLRMIYAYCNFKLRPIKR